MEMAQRAIERTLERELKGLSEEELVQVLKFVRLIKTWPGEKARLDFALKLYQEGKGSIGYIAGIIGVPKRELIREARRRGIEPEFSNETLAEEIV